MKKLIAVLSLLAIAQMGFAQQTTTLKESFIMVDRNLTRAGWVDEFTAMKNIGMTTGILISVGQLDGSAGVAGGPCTSLSTTGLLYPSSLVSLVPDRLEDILSAADAVGLQIRVGSLQTHGTWTDGTEFNALRSCNLAVMTEIKNRYGSHPSLSAPYWTQEIWLNWVKYYSTSGQPYYGSTQLHQFITDMTTVDPTWKVLVAPVFKKTGVDAMPGLTVADTQNALDTFLTDSGAQLVAPQDGIGAGDGAPPIEEIGGYYQGMKSIALSHGTELWSTLETFTNSGNDQNKYPPAPIGRIIQQINAEGPFVTGQISWIFGHDMSPQATYYPVQASHLYMDYQSYVSSLPRPVKIPFLYGYQTATLDDTLPSSSYPDPSNTKLTDGTGGGFGSDGTDSVGSLDSEDGNHLNLLTIFDQTRAISRVRILFRSELASWIELPQVVTLRGRTSSIRLTTTLDVAAFRGTIENTMTQVVNTENTSDFSVHWVDIDIPTGLINGVRYLYIEISHVGWLLIDEVEIYGT